MYILNSFSLNMIGNFPALLAVEEISRGEAVRLAKTETSAVGHEDTAKIFSAVLGVEVPMNRTSLSLRSGDEALVGQYFGPRLPEGVITLPEGAVIRWLLVRIS